MSATSEINRRWPRSRLKYLADFQAGEGITWEDIREEGDYPVYGGNGLRGFTDAYTHDGEFVVLGRQGALCGNVNYAQGKFWASEHAVVVRPRPGVNVKFLGETLRSMDLRQYSMSAAQPGLSVEFVENLSALLPPITVQRRIADYLDAETAEIDALISEKEQMLNLLEEKRSALVTHAVTRGLDSKAKLKPSGVNWLGDVPAHWAISRLKFLAQVRTGLTIGKDYKGQSLSEYYYLRVANVQDGYLSLDDLATVAVPESEAMSCLLERGDVLMNEGGDIDKLGRGCVWREEVSPCLHQNHVFCVRPHAVDPEWLATFTATRSAKLYFESRAKRTTNLASISSTNIKEVTVPLPPPSEQQLIMQYLAKSNARIDEVCSSTRRAVELLKERRSALITAAVTGQIPIEEMAA